MTRAEEAAFQEGYKKAKIDTMKEASYWIYDNFWKYGNRNDFVEAFREKMKEKL